MQSINVTIKNNATIINTTIKTMQQQKNTTKQIATTTNTTIKHSNKKM